jgi:hypothetical protein
MKKHFTFTLLFFFAYLLKVAGQSTTVLPGVVLPQMTTAQRIGITSVQNGMLVFDTDTQSYWFRQSGVWVNLTSGGSSNYWHLNGAGGNEIRNTNTGGFWSASASVLPEYPNNTTHPPTAPVSGAGTRLMWIPSRSAFRVGTVSSAIDSVWNANNLGFFSFAAGYNAMASNYYSTAIGYRTYANGINSMAMGNATTSSGYSSTAMGISTLASGEASTAMGYNTKASGFYSTAMGSGSRANGTISTAIGYNADASGLYSIAIGNTIKASGEASTAMGKYTNTNGKLGSFIIGDADPYLQGETIVGIDNQFVGRFANGYWLMTCGDKGNGNPTDNVRTGIRAGAGANAWSSISDSTKKEKHQLIDGEGLLQKIAKFRLTTWNYKGQDPKTFRHYGPMAQDFYAAFGKDNYGSIGNDTLINQADFDGINFTAIQALVKRTDDLTRINEELKSKNEALEKRLARLETVLLSLKENADPTSSDRNPIEAGTSAGAFVKSNTD